MTQVRLSQVSKVYGTHPKPDSAKAVNNISLQINSGEFFVILGPSGCGKTSTLRMIAGLEDIWQGEIYLDDRLANHVPPGQRNLGMAFESYALYPPLNVYENIAYGLRARRVAKGEIEQRVREITELLEMDDILDRLPRHLSGGQQQLVSLARALVRRAPLLLLDEPLSHLEPAKRFRVRTALKDFTAHTRMTVIYVTHDQVEATALADRVAVMSMGVLQQVGTPTQLWNMPANRFVAGFIGEPPMNFLKGDTLREYVGRIDVADQPEQVVEVGIRPQDLRILNADDTTQNLLLDGQMQAVQWLGHESHLFCQINGSTVIIVLPPTAQTPFQPGMHVRIGAQQRNLHLFHADGSRQVADYITT